MPTAEKGPWESLTEAMSDPPLAGGDNGIQAPAIIETVPPIVTPRPPQGGRRGQKQDIPPQTNQSGYAWRKPAYFKGFLDKFAGSSETIRVEKRDEVGHLHFISAFSMHDLDRYDHIEEFLLTLVPTYNYGTYEVALTNATGQVTRSATYRIADPNMWRPRPADPSEKHLERIERLEADLLKAKGSGGQQDTYMLLMELNRLRMDMAHSAPAPLPMMPMMPPEPVMNPADLVKAVAEAIKVLQPPPAPPPQIDHRDRFTYKDLIALLPTVQSLLKDVFGVMVKPMTEMVEAIGGETQELRRELREMNKPKGLGDILAEMKILKEAADTFRPNGPAAGESFAGVLKELFSNLPDKINAITRLASEVRASETQRLPAGPQPQVMPRLPAPQQAQAQLAAPPVVQEPPAAPAPAPAPAPEPPPPFDPRFVEAVRQIGLAKDNGDRIGNTIGAIIILGEQPYWQRFTDHLKTLAKAASGGDAVEKKKLMALFRTFLNDLSETPVLKDVFPVSAAETTYNAFVEHADKVITMIAAS